MRPALRALSIARAASRIVLIAFIPRQRIPASEIEAIFYHWVSTLSIRFPRCRATTFAQPAVMPRGWPAAGFLALPAAPTRSQLTHSKALPWFSVARFFSMSGTISLRPNSGLQFQSRLATESSIESGHPPAIS